MSRPTIALLDIENKLATLRILWKEQPHRRYIIKRQARALQIVKEKLMLIQGYKGIK